MESHELSFAKINILQEDIAEVIVSEGVELNANLVDEFHRFLLSNLRTPFSILVNRVNSYAYDFAAQRSIGSLEEINATAVVAYTQPAKAATEILTSIPRDKEFNLRIFSSREEGLVWLISEQEKLSNTDS